MGEVGPLGKVWEMGVWFQGTNPPPAGSLHIYIFFKAYFIIYIILYVYNLFYIYIFTKFIIS